MSRLPIGVLAFPPRVLRPRTCLTTRGPPVLRPSGPEVIVLDATNAAARDSVTSGTRRFFHWTPRPYAASIRFTGFRPSPFGVHVSTDPEYFRQPGDVRLTIEVPEELIRPAWRVADLAGLHPGVDHWRLPTELATRCLNGRKLRS